jgi:hypothetical protein
VQLRRRDRVSRVLDQIYNKEIVELNRRADLAHYRRRLESLAI